MKFGHLIEYNMRNIILEKSYTKCVGETIFEEKCFSYFPLLIDQMLLSGSLYFVQYVYWAICILQLFEYQVLI